jgi:ACT domain-containing protein
VNFFAIVIYYTIILLFNKVVSVASAVTSVMISLSTFFSLRSHICAHIKGMGQQSHLARLLAEECPKYNPVLFKLFSNNVPNKCK